MQVWDEVRTVAAHSPSRVMADSPTGPGGGRPRRSYTKEPVARRLEVPTNVLDEHYPNNADLRAGLAKGGLTQAHLDALRAALEPALAADGVQAAAQQAAGAGSATLKAAMPATEAAYDEVFRRAKAAGRMDASLKAALDVGPKATNRTKRLAQMRTFLNAAAGSRAALDGYGTTDEHVEGAEASLARAEAASATWARLDKEAEDATRERDRLMGPLDAAMRDVQERGKAGMPERWDLLELLGLPPA